MLKKLGDRGRGARAEINYLRTAGSRWLESPTTPLLYVLSDDLELRGPKFGCGPAPCGACAVIAGGRAIRACVTFDSTKPAADIVSDIMAEAEMSLSKNFVSD